MSAKNELTIKKRVRQGYCVQSYFEFIELSAKDFNEFNEKRGGQLPANYEVMPATPTPERTTLKIKRTILVHAPDASAMTFTDFCNNLKTTYRGIVSGRTTLDEQTHDIWHDFWQPHIEKMFERPKINDDLIELYEFIKSQSTTPPADVPEEIESHQTIKKTIDDLIF